MVYLPNCHFCHENLFQNILVPQYLDAHRRHRTGLYLCILAKNKIIKNITQLQVKDNV